MSEKLDTLFLESNWRISVKYFMKLCMNTIIINSNIDQIKKSIRKPYALTL